MKKCAIIYFSRTSTTKPKAKMLSKILGVPAIEIKASKPYSKADINWHDDRCRVRLEQDDPNVRPEIETVKPPRFDVLFLGYPTWFGIPPKLIDTFLEGHSWEGKTIVPFTTSGSVSAERGGMEIRRILPGVDVRDAKRTNDLDEAGLKEWVKSLNI